ncbi:GTPase activating protein [Phlyctochytrium planicorne]|nr:GTPase activating protein [Phlyctochytrium planicorne]
MSKPKAAPKEDLMQLRLLWAKSNVSTRLNESTVSLGFLFLAHCQQLQMLDLSSASMTSTDIEEDDEEDPSSASLPANNTITPSTNSSNDPPTLLIDGLSIDDKEKGKDKKSEDESWQTVKESSQDAAATNGETQTASKSGKGKERETLFLGFIAKKDISKGELPLFREAATRTRNAAKASPFDLQAEVNDLAAEPFQPPNLIYPLPDATQTITLPLSTSTFHLLTDPTPPVPPPYLVQDRSGIQVILAPLSQITGVVIEPILTLTTAGDSACLTRMGVEIGDEDLPQLWFERDEIGRDMEVEEVVGEMRRWLGSVGKVLIRPTEEKSATTKDAAASATATTKDAAASATSSKTATPSTPQPTPSQPRPITPTVEEEEEEQARRTRLAHLYILNNKGAPESLASLTVEVVAKGGKAPGLGQDKSEWPIALPISQSSLIYKIGAFGIGVAATIAGPTISNKVEDITKSAAWDVMERFSRVTKFAQTTTKQVAEHPLARPILPYIPQQIRGYVLTSAEVEVLLEDYDSAGLYLQRWAGEVQGRFLSKKGSQGKKEDVVVVTVDKTRDFEVLSIGRASKRTDKKITAEEWILMYDDQGRLTKTEEEIKTLIFYGGLDDDVRGTAWKYLLKVFPWNSTEAERSAIMVEKTRIYIDTKTQWKTILADATTESNARGVNEEAEAMALAGDEREEGDVVSKIKERRYRVEKDVVRTDRTVAFFAGDADDDRPISVPAPGSAADSNAAPPRTFSRNLEMLKDVLITYTVHNFELGYVQGMNDLLAPILATVGEEVEERIDSANLFCCFRWLLVMFKRELNFEDTMSLWENLWACPFSNHFHLFVALAILNKYRSDIIGGCRAFDECLKFTNDLSGNLDLPDILRRAEVLFEVFRQMITIAAWERLGINIEIGYARSDGSLPVNPTVASATATSATASSATSTTPASARPVSPANRALSPAEGGSERRGRSGSNASRASARSTSGSPSRGGIVEVDIEGIWDLLGLLENKGL